MQMECSSALFEVHPLKHGDVLVSLLGYCGEEDFYTLHQVMLDILQPEDAGYSVDAMCVGGYVRKDGILLRTSSESPYDTCSIVYAAAKLTQEETDTVKGWIKEIVRTLRERKPPVPAG